MATWFLLLGAVMNLVALLLFGVGYRAPADHALRLERAALGTAVVTAALCASGPALMWARGAYDFVTAYVSGTTYSPTHGGAWAPLTRWLMWRVFLLHAVLVPIPTATWLGLMALRRAHAAERT